MARGRKKNTQIEGQISLQMCMNPSLYVVQHNQIVRGRQSLSLNAAKLIRMAIMQIRKEDKEFSSYVVTVPELAKTLNVLPDNLYRDANEITSKIVDNPVFIRTPDGKGFIKIPWVEACAYHPEVGISIKLNNALRTFLLNLKEQYTQYQIESVLSMKSVYSIRIFELLMERIKMNLIPKNGLDFTIPVQEIRECCDCEAKLLQYGQFREKVLDKAKEEINSKTTYRMNYEAVRAGRKVTDILFHVNMMYHPDYWPNNQIEVDNG